jgi:hypothetical protein
MPQLRSNVMSAAWPRSAARYHCARSSANWSGDAFAARAATSSHIHSTMLGRTGFRPSNAPQ